jgi:hypothetical protein
MVSHTSHRKSVSSHLPRQIECGHIQGDSPGRAAALRLMELEWQKEMIQQWLRGERIPQEARQQLEESLAVVLQELALLKRERP